MAKQKKEVKLKVTFTEGYEQRFTQACLKQLENRKRAEDGLAGIATQTAGITAGTNVTHRIGAGV